MGAAKKLGETVISTSRGNKLEASGKSSVPMPLFPAKSVAVMTGRGVMQPSASAPLKSPEPTPKISVDSNKETFSGSRSFSDKNKYSRQSGLSGIDPNTEERIRDLEEVKDDLLSRAKERRSKTQEVKEDAMTRMGTDDSELNKITLTCNGVKKLLPYNGFYPVLRTTQLGSILSQSVAENIGGIGWKDGKPTSANSEYSGALAVQSLIQPWFAPGIVYNSIKSGIALVCCKYT